MTGKINKESLCGCLRHRLVLLAGLYFLGTSTSNVHSPREPKSLPSASGSWDLDLENMYGHQWPETTSLFILSELCPELHI